MFPFCLMKTRIFSNSSRSFLENMKVTNKVFQRIRGKRDGEHSYSVNLNKFYRTQQYFTAKVYDGPSIKYVQSNLGLLCGFKISTVN